MADAREKGLRQKAHRQRLKEKQQATERQLQELSEKVTALQLERDELQRAVKTATSEAQGSKGQGLPDTDQFAVTFYFGEATAQTKLTKRALRALTVHQMADIWKTLIQKMAMSLQKVDVAPRNCHFQTTLQGLVHEAISFLWALVMYKPSLLRVINTCSMEDPTAAQPCRGNTRNWPAILAEMQLSEKQAEQLLECRTSLLQEVGALIAEWDSMWEELQSVKDLEERPAGEAVNHAPSSSGLAERLRTNVGILHSSGAFYQSYVCAEGSPNPLETKLLASYEVLTPVQVARYLVASYPMGPDTLSLMTCLAQQAKEPSSADEQMHFGFQEISTCSSPPSINPARNPFCAVPDSKLKEPLQALHGGLQLPELTNLITELTPPDSPAQSWSFSF